jgi:hypothetical protein
VAAVVSHYICKWLDVCHLFLYPLPTFLNQSALFLIGFLLN